MDSFQSKKAFCVKNISLKPDSIVLTTIVAIRRAQFHHRSPNITNVGLFHHVIYCSVDAHCWQCASTEELITWSNKPTLSIIVRAGWNLAFIDNKNDREYNDISFVDISKILETRNAFFFQLNPFDGIQRWLSKDQNSPC